MQLEYKQLYGKNQAIFESEKGKDILTVIIVILVGLGLI